MKSRNKLFSIIIVIVILLSGCSIKNENVSNGSIFTGFANNPSSKEKIYTFRAEIIELGDTLLVVPDKSSKEYKASDKFSVKTENTIIIKKGNKEITKDDLERGDIVNISYNGTILESYPAQISSESIEVIGHNHLIEGYLAIIDDIYKEDNGLNSNIKMIALDTTEWKGLSKQEKKMLFTILGEKYKLKIIEGTFDELTKKGFINKKRLYFTNGILITLSKVKYNDKKTSINCSIMKWRSGLGAIGSDHVSAKYKHNIWKIKRKGLWIS